MKYGENQAATKAFYDTLDRYTNIFSVIIGNIYDNPELLEVPDNG